MTLSDKLKRDIQKAIHTYSKRYKRQNDIPFARQVDIHRLHAILKDENNPLILRSKLLDYLDNLSKGLMAFLPFLDVNHFKYEVKKVLDYPQYQEIAILKALLSEKNTVVESDVMNIVSINGDTIEDRVSNLERQSKYQEKNIIKLNEEIHRLTSENKFLSDAIQSLSAVNQTLKKEKEQLSLALTQQQSDYSKLSEQYKVLSQENERLKRELQSFQGQQKTERPVSKEVTIKTQQSSTMSHSIINHGSYFPNSSVVNDESLQSKFAMKAL